MGALDRSHFPGDLDALVLNVRGPSQVDLLDHDELRVEFGKRKEVADDCLEVINAIGGVALHNRPGVGVPKSHDFDIIRRVVASFLKKKLCIL